MKSVMKNLGLVLSISLACAPGAAQSAGFTQDDLAKAARANDAELLQTLAARRIAARTEILRAVLATNLPNAGRRISRDELQVLTMAMGEPTPTRDIMLSWLMRSGVTTATDGETSGIYNPLADAWLVLRWTELGGSPRLTDAVLVQGTRLRPAASEPDWLDSPAPFAIALLQTKLHAIGSFSRLARSRDAAQLFRLLGTIREGERAAVLRRSQTMLGAVSAWSRANGSRLAALDRITRRHSDPVMLALPDRVRGALSPMAVIVSPQGTLLVLQSPVYPAKMVIAAFPGTGTGTVPVLSLIDLAPTAVRSAAR